MTLAIIIIIMSVALATKYVMSWSTFNKGIKHILLNTLVFPMSNVDA